MSEPKLTRRALFGLRGNAQTPQRAPFSLDRFYAERSTLPTTEPMQIKLREGLEPVATSRVGVPELAGGPSPRATEDPGGGAVLGVPGVGGVVRILTSRCLAWQSSFCSVCSERCPVPGAIVVEQGRPSVVADACTGCGVCVTLCPAPINAFEVVARSE